MKKILTLSLLFLGFSAFAQNGLLDRFDDPEKGHTTFIPKGCRAIGITGNYRSFSVGGEKENDGYSVLSFLNIGDGSLRKWDVAPSFNIFVADDVSLGLRLDYSGYALDTDLKVDLRDLLNVESNFQITSRHMVHNAWGASFVARKYLSFFGSKTFGVFGEGRLYGNYGITTSFPYTSEGVAKEEKTRTSRGLQAGIKLAGGVAVRLREGSTLSISIPVIGAGYQYTWQHKLQGYDNGGQLRTNDAHMSSFNISRNIDFLAIQVGYSRFIEPKK